MPILKSLSQLNPVKSSIYLVLVITIMRLLVIGFPELTNDEAQYALYGYYLDWSYFDHPSLVGWLNALVLAVSDSDFALRLWPVALSALSAFLIYSLTRELFPDLPERVAFYAVALFQVPVILQVLGMVMLPDTPLIPVVLSIALVLFRTCRDDTKWSWLWLGLLFGIAGLSKYTAITIVPSVALAIVLFRNKKLLFSPWPWLSIIVAALVVSPVFIWNVQHDWISIQYQLGHGIPDKDWQLKRMLESQLGQVIAVTPIIFIAAWSAMAREIVKGNSHAESSITFGIRYLAIFALPVLLLFGFNGGYEHSLLHWTAVAWALLIPVVAVQLYLSWSSRWLRVITYLSIMYSVVLVLTLHSLLVFNWLPFKENQHPLNDIIGWQQVATRAVQVRATLIAKNKNSNLKLFIGNWSVFSRLAWYARPVPVVITDTRLGQSDLWYGAPQLGDSGVMVVPPKYHGKPQVNGTAKFESCHLIETVEATIRDKVAASYQLFYCEQYKG